MWAIMILSYSIVSIIDMNSFVKSDEKGRKLLYIILMAMSCIIGIANGYATDMPSPADTIKDIVKALIGS
jgi:hypothetical protein